MLVNRRGANPYGPITRTAYNALRAAYRAPGGASFIGRAARGAARTLYNLGKRRFMASGGKDASRNPKRTRESTEIKTNRSKVKGLRKRRGRTTKSLTNRVKELESQSKGKALLTFRARTTGKSLGQLNTVTYFNHNLNDSASMQSALDNLKYYDPANPATLITSDPDAAAFQSSIEFKSMHFAVTYKNNYQVPINLTFYVLRCARNGSNTPQTGITNGLTDKGVTTAYQLTYPSDSDIFKKDWIPVRKSVNVYLQPGESYTIRHTETKSIMYDPAYYDQHPSTYVKAFRSTVVLVRMIGALAHDDATNINNMLCAADVEVLTTYKIKYDAGADLDLLQVNDYAGIMVNNVVHCNKPAADNQGYSAI